MGQHIEKSELVDGQAFEVEEVPSLKLSVDHVPESLGQFEVPDCLWPSDNDAGIPLLDFSKQADAVDIPVNIWGAANGRTVLTRSGGTVLFYTEDYRFGTMWKNPSVLVRGKVVNAGEVNYSVYSQMPPAVALYQVYRKRWIARYWQECGLRIFVDLNVAVPYWKMNLLGVPAGWHSYCTRGYSARIDDLEFEFSLASDHAGGSILFLVYGGGKAVKQWCQEHAGVGVVWIPEEMDVRKGRELPFDGNAIVMSSGQRELPNVEA